MAEDAEDRSEAATGKRLQQARDQGNVPLSRDVSGFAALGAGLVLLILTVPAASRDLSLGLRGFFLLRGGDIPVRPLLLTAAWLAVRAAGPLLLGVMLAGLGATWLQTGFLVHLGALRPDPARLSPLRGLKRIAGRDQIIELLKSLAKMLLLGFALARILRRELPRSQESFFLSLPDLLRRLRADVTLLVLTVLLAQGAIVAVDLFWVRLRHKRQLRMSREEVKQEHKDMEGDPHIKGKRKRLRFLRARRRMMAAIPKATVIVTNPTHYAIALSYERGKSQAPRVVAKGMDDIAAAIRALAEEHKVPIVRSPPLARALYLVELDAEIPAEHFQTVAEIIAYVWRLRKSFRTG